jgi:hypothetical protein
LHKLRDLINASQAEFRPLKFDCQAANTAQDFYRAVDMQSRLGLPRDRHDFVALVDELRRPSGQVPVILIDEIDPLLSNSYEGSEEQKLIATFRQLSHTDEFRFILFGANVLYEKLYDPTSPMLNFGEEIILSYLDKTSVRELIIEPMTQMDITFSDQDEFVEQVIHFSSCYPSLVQRICRKSIEQLSRTSSHHLTLDILDEIVSSSDFCDDYLGAVWGDVGPLEKLISLVMVLNDTSVTDTQIRELLTETGVTAAKVEVEAALRNLRVCSILRRENRYYTLIPARFPEVVRRILDIEEKIRELKEEWGREQNL